LPATCEAINEAALSVVFKKAKAKTGVTVMTADGPKFFPENDIPEHLRGCETVPGRLECFEDGPKFVPGKVMEIHGVKTFIPGKFLKESILMKTFSAENYRVCAYSNCQFKFFAYWFYECNGFF
jgi:hypothetical protein